MLELASCVARAPVPSVDVGKDGDDLPISNEIAAIVDVVGAGKYMDVLGAVRQFVLMPALCTRGSRSEKL